MADKKLGLKETMKLAPRVELKKNEPDLQATEQIVEKLHRELTPEPEQVATVDMKRITLDVPIDLYKGMKMKVFDNGITLKRYILSLVAKDLGK